MTYSNQAKQDFLGVAAETLEEHGAVSEAVPWDRAAVPSVLLPSWNVTAPVGVPREGGSGKTIYQRDKH